MALQSQKSPSHFRTLSHDEANINSNNNARLKNDKDNRLVEQDFQ